MENNQSNRKMVIDKNHTKSPSPSFVDLSISCSFDSSSSEFFNSSNDIDMTLKDLPTIDDPATFHYLDNEPPPSRIPMDIAYVSPPRFNSPVNLPLRSTGEFPDPPRQVLVDTTFVTGNKRPRPEDSAKDGKIHPFADDEGTERAKRHRRSTSTSTLGSTDALWMNENVKPAPLLPPPTYVFCPVYEYDS